MSQSSGDLSGQATGSCGHKKGSFDTHSTYRSCCEKARGECSLNNPCSVSKHWSADMWGIVRRSRRFKTKHGPSQTDGKTPDGISSDSVRQSHPPPGTARSSAGSGASRRRRNRDSPNKTGVTRGQARLRARDSLVRSGSTQSTSLSGPAGAVGSHPDGNARSGPAGTIRPGPAGTARSGPAGTPSRSGWTGLVRYLTMSGPVRYRTLFGPVRYIPMFGPVRYLKVSGPVRYLLRLGPAQRLALGPTLTLL